MDASQETLLQDARAFFEGVVPIEQAVSIELRYAGMTFSISSSELSVNVLQRSVAVGAEASRFLKLEKLKNALRHWPRLVKALEESELVGLRVGVHVYPLEVLVVSPELLLGENGANVGVELVTQPKENPVKPFGLEAYYAASLFYHCSDTVHAQEKIALALAQQPANVVFLVMRGCIEARNKGAGLKVAAATFKAVHDLNARYAKNYYRLASVLLERGKAESAAVALLRGQRHGVFETRLGTKLFTLGRLCIRQMSGAALQTTVNRGVAFCGSSALGMRDVYTMVFDRLRIWTLFELRLVCVAWDELFKRYMGLRYGSHRLTLEQRAAIEAANGWKTLTVAGFLNGAWESGRVKLLPTTQLKRFRYFYDQWVEERFLVWRRFLAFLERELELATPDERFSLCQSLRASHQSGHFLTDVYTLSGALSDPHLPAIRLIEAGNPNQEQHFFREFAINKVHIPGGCIRLDTASAKSADQPVPHMISRAESKPHPVGWVLQPHKWNDGQGIFLAELNVIRHRVEDPLLQPYNFVKAYGVPRKYY